MSVARASMIPITRAIIPRAMDHTRGLPAEILEFVFMHLKLSDPNGNAGFDAAWIEVTWVCRRWRQIALRCSALWAATTIVEYPGPSGDPFEGARTLLKRASPRPLTLVAVTAPVLHVLEPYAHRVRSMNLKISPEHLKDGFSTTQAIQALPNMGTILTRLSLSGYQGRMPWYPKNAPEFPIITLHASAFPSLQFLEVDDVALDVVGRMTNLEVFQGRGLSEITGQKQVLKDILKAMPNVRRIDLDNFIPDPDIVSTRPTLVDDTPVVLRKLEVLEITELTYDIPILLEMICIPPTARLVITGNFYGADPTTILNDIFPHDRDPLVHVRPTSMLDIAVEQNGHISVSGYIGSPSRDLPSWKINARELINSQDRDDYGGEDEVLEHFVRCYSTVLAETLRAVPPLQPTELRLSIPSTTFISRDVKWAEWLQHLTSVHSMTIEGSLVARHVVDTLKANPRLLPSLNRITLLLDLVEMAPSAEALEQWTLGRARGGRALDEVFAGPSKQEVLTCPLFHTLQQLLESAAKHVGRTQMISPEGQPIRVE
ncbi:hypothetical protein C8Q73DRAFT_821654 [Cubamyces lactineus]|nr:hypothetical protein C8Q73DRAFT_821654 [Cubamyces lactineus]